MKIDLVGPKNRGLTMGINESTGYLSLGLIAFLSAFIASDYRLHPYPFYIGFLVFLGLLTSILFIKDPRSFAKLESQTNTSPKLKRVFKETTFSNSNLSSITIAGLANNLNDGMIWGYLRFYSTLYLYLLVKLVY